MKLLLMFLVSINLAFAQITPAEYEDLRVDDLKVKMMDEVIKCLESDSPAVAYDRTCANLHGLGLQDEIIAIMDREKDKKKTKKDKLIKEK